MVRIDGYTETDDDTDWRSLWLKYAMLLPGIGDPPTEEDEQDDWIDDAVDVFCRQHRMRQRFESFWAVGEER